MSMHLIPLTDIEREGLKNHGLGRSIGKPSQFADCFRKGVKWGQDQERSRLHAENEALHAENEALQSGYDAARLEIARLQTEVAKYRESMTAGGYVGCVVWAGDAKVVRRLSKTQVSEWRSPVIALQVLTDVCASELARFLAKQTGETP